MTIQPNTAEIPIAITILTPIIILDMSSNWSTKSGGAVEGIAGMAVMKTIEITTPPIHHKIPKTIKPMNVIRAQFFLFSRPIAAATVAEDSKRNAKKKSRIFWNMKAATQGMCWSRPA